MDAAETFLAGSFEVLGLFGVTVWGLLLEGLFRV